MKRTATDEGIGTAREEDEAGIAHLVEGGTSGLDAVDQPGCGRDPVASAVVQRLGRRA